MSNGTLPGITPGARVCSEHPVARDSHPQPVALGGRGALRRTEVPPDATTPMRRMNSLLLLMIFCTGKTTYVVARDDPREGHGRGDGGASGRPKKRDAQGLWGEWEHPKEGENTPKLKQLYGAIWRTETNRTECTAGRKHGAPGDTPLITGGGLYGTWEAPEERTHARRAETCTGHSAKKLAPRRY